MRDILRERPDDLDALEEEVQWRSIARIHAVYYGRLLREEQVLIQSPGVETLLPAASSFPPAAKPGVALGKIEKFRTSSGKTLFLASALVLANGGSKREWVYQVALDISHEENILSSYRRKVLMVMVLGAVISAGASTWIAHRGIGPIREITSAAQRITISALNERVSARAWPRELASLAAEFDRMLERLEDSFNRLSRFSADIAHELRTPINNLMGESEVALLRDRSPEDYRRILASSLETEIADVTLSDSFQSSTLFRTANGFAALSGELVGVVPFNFVKGSHAPATITGVTAANVNAALAGTLTLGQIAGNIESTPVHAVGRNEDSDTRIAALVNSSCPLNFSHTNPPAGPFVHQYVVSGSTYVSAPAATVNGINYPLGDGGYVKGGDLAAALSAAPAITTAYCIGYHGLTDTAALTGSAHAVNFNSHPYSSSNVENGLYTFWSYEHFPLSLHLWKFSSDCSAPDCELIKNHGCRRSKRRCSFERHEIPQNRRRGRCDFRWHTSKRTVVENNRTHSSLRPVRMGTCGRFFVNS